MEMAAGLLVHVRARATDPDGPREKGLVILVEGIRWLGVEWDSHPGLAGLRRAGFAGAFEYWRWQTAWDTVLLHTMRRRKPCSA